MTSITSEIYSVAAVRAIDRCAIEQEGIPGYTLMSRAGEAATDFAEDCFPASKNWLVLCGSGNNAGDGYVVARLAAERGMQITVVTLTAPEQLAGDARLAWQDYVAAGGETKPWPAPMSADLVIDATGKYVIPGLVDMHVHIRPNGEELGPRALELRRALAGAGAHESRRERAHAAPGAR